MITKDDIAILKEMREWLDPDGWMTHGCWISPPRNVLEWKNSLGRILDQPYQQGEMIEVATGLGFTTPPIHAVFLSSDLSCAGVWCLSKKYSGRAIYYPLHRPIKQTVQVTLDKEIKEAAKIGNQNMSLRGPISFEDQEILMARKFVCNAIASQDGGDNE